MHLMKYRPHLNTIDNFLSLHFILKMEKSNQNSSIARKNYMFLLIGIALIVLGYLLMIGGGSEDPNKFNPEIFSTQRITIAPITCLAGFVLIIFAIMFKPKQEKD